MKHYAVIPTHNRPKDLAELLGSIGPDVDVLVIDNASTGPETSEVVFQLAEAELDTAPRDPRFSYLRDEEQPPNLSRLWNLGVDWAAARFGDHHADHSCDPAVCKGVCLDSTITILNDDVVLPEKYFTTMAHELTEHAVDIAFPGADARCCRVNRFNGPVDLAHRMTGFCFTLRGNAGLRADERLRWWCGDDDIEQSALQHGRGTVKVPFLGTQGIVHKYPGKSTTGVLAEQTNADMKTYVQKWGFRPWG